MIVFNSVRNCVTSFCVSRHLFINKGFAKFSFVRGKHCAPKMNYFVIGVSGVTCGGKTTLSKLLQKSFPWCRVIHQDTYFYDDDSEHHIRLGPELQNHANYEVITSLNMDQMCNDVDEILKGPPVFSKAVEANNGNVPNFETGQNLLNSVGNVDFDNSKYSHIPVLILEGFTLFECQPIFDKCDVRFFLTLEEEECRARRTERTYEPPDIPGYFDAAIWPEYLKHFSNFIENRPGITVFDGKTDIKTVWSQSLEIVACRLNEKYALTENSVSNVNSV